MIRRAIPIVLALILTACGQQGPDDTVGMEADTAELEVIETDWLTGKQAYEKVCAGCHEEGLNGAPRTGDKDAWDKRSWLWEAVLFEHAKEGYGNMPAKGSDETLDDATVTRAAEYMLTLTYPERHRD